MDANHADRACTLCRQRRVRCDKNLPTCRRCSKFGQTCPGYPARQRFINQSSTIQKRLNDEVIASNPKSSRSSNSSRVDSINPDPRVVQHRAGGISPVLHAASEQHSFLFAPGQTGVSATNEAVFTPPGTVRHASHRKPTASLPPSAQHEESSMDVSMQQLLEDSGSDYFDLDIESYYANGTNACGFFPGIPVTLPPGDEFGVLDGMHDPKLMGAENSVPTGSRSATNAQSPAPQTDVSKEVVLLVRLFVEYLAPWMDLFDIDAYFTRVLPCDTMPNILLQSAVAAVAAKQTARHVMNGHALSASGCYAYIMANYQNITSNEWFYKAACYYDQGISHLRSCLQQSSAFVTRSSSSGSSTLTQISLHDNPAQSSAQKDPNQLVSKQTDLQHLFSAISVLSLYESLDDCFAISSQHLPGFLALFDRGDIPALPRSLPAGRAAFWYFARKEALSSYAHHVRPRIDPDNITIWDAAGLPPWVFNFLWSGSSNSNSPRSTVSAVCEERDATPCALIWMLVKVVDLITRDDDHLSTTSRSPLTSPFCDTTKSTSHIDGHPRTFSSTWDKLRELLKQWYDHRPSLLTPHATMETNGPYNASGKPLRVAFFASPIGAAVSQIYHFIQILLLVNQPSSRGNHGFRLRMLKDNSAEVEYHSREICAIALGRQPLAIQRHMSHPLQLAGTCFETKEERDAITELLREIEIETGSTLQPPG